jgi:hypothetical protein
MGKTAAYDMNNYSFIFNERKKKKKIFRFFANRLQEFHEEWRNSIAMI